MQQTEISKPFPRFAIYLTNEDTSPVIGADSIRCRKNSSVIQYESLQRISGIISKKSFKIRKAKDHKIYKLKS